MQQAHARVERDYDQVQDRDSRPDLSLVDLDLNLEPSHSRPRRPTGAAADYARGATDGRRTIQIGGHGAQTALRPTPSELRGPRPDRIAAWAFGFAIFLAILAALVGG